MASWDSGSGMVTDAFKPGQAPGASTMPPAAGTAVAAVPSGAPGPGTGPAAQPSPAGVDSSLGGLY